MKLLMHVMIKCNSNTNCVVENMTGNNLVYYILPFNCLVQTFSDTLWSNDLQLFKLQRSESDIIIIHTKIPSNAQKLGGATQNVLLDILSFFFSFIFLYVTLTGSEAQHGRKLAHIVITAVCVLHICASAKH